MHILVTGAAGFIGMHMSKRMLDMGNTVVGIDNLNSYYEVELKYGRLANLGIQKEEIRYNKELNGHQGFTFVEMDICDAGNLMSLFSKQKFDVVIHLAAQAGVRYSITNPRDYIDSNITGFFNIIESCRSFPIQHFIFASSSSVYGNSVEVPFKTDQHTDKPVSLYAATKKANELLAYNYAHLYQIPSTGLRFFTVYGPWGRPDMAYFSFTKKIIRNEPIDLYNGGALHRDFTYIDDITESISRLIHKKPNSSTPFSLYNIGNQNPVFIKDFVAVLEQLLDKKAITKVLPMQDGDVLTTFADCEPLESLTGFSPNTSIQEGLERFIGWYMEYYKV